MGKVKDMLMDIQEKTWEAIENNTAIGFEELVKQVAVATGYGEKFVAPVVEEEYLDYKRDNEGDEGYEGYGVVEAEYD